MWFQHYVLKFTEFYFVTCITFCIGRRCGVWYTTRATIKEIVVRSQADRLKIIPWVIATFHTNSRLRVLSLSRWHTTSCWFRTTWMFSSPRNCDPAGAFTSGDAWWIARPSYGYVSNNKHTASADMGWVLTAITTWRRTPQKIMEKKKKIYIVISWPTLLKDHIKILFG